MVRDQEPPVEAKLDTWKEDAAPSVEAPPAILVVEDDPDLLLLARSRLAAEGYGVIEAGSGADALAKLERPLPEIALVLLDLSLPDLDGEEVLARIRVTRPDLPVIVCSGRTEEELRDLRGASATVRKPYRWSSLLERVRAFVPGPAGDPNR